MFFSFSTKSVVFAEEVKGKEDYVFVEVVGKSEEVLKADCLIFDLLIREENQKMEEAKRLASEKENALKNTLIELKLENKLHSKSLNIQELLAFQNGERKMVGYELNHLFQLEIENMEVLNKVIDKINKNKIEILNTSYCTKQKEVAYQRAMQNALQNAKHKVENLFKNKDFKVVSLFEEYEENYPQILRQNYHAKNNLILENEIKISCQLKVKFMVQEKR